MSPRAKVDLLVLFPEADVSMMHGHGVVIVCSVVECCCMLLCWQRGLFKMFQSFHLKPRPPPPPPAAAAELLSDAM